MSFGDSPTCECGCGQPTTLIDYNSADGKIVKGEYRRFVLGHGYKSPPHELVWNEEDQCFDVTLNRGLVTKVDREDAYLMREKHWYVTGYGRKLYVHHNPNVEGERVLKLHRLIAQAPEGLLVDHINGNSLDNRRSNLRLATIEQNRAHITRPQANNRSGVTGVYWREDNKKWVAQINANGKRKHLGCFESKEEAIAARVEAAKTLHGDFIAKDNLALA